MGGLQVFASMVGKTHYPTEDWEEDPTDSCFLMILFSSSFSKIISYFLTRIM